MATKQIPGKIEAESYDAMAGVQTQPTTDIGSGLNVSYIDNGDWMDYTISAPSAGNYDVNFRVASPNVGAQFQVKRGTTVLATVTVPNTAGWQTYVTVTGTIALLAGTQTIRIASTGAGWNFNWMDVETSIPVPVPKTVEADINILLNGVPFKYTLYTDHTWVIPA